jgi:hypothetical protein
MDKNNSHRRTDVGVSCGGLRSGIFSKKEEKEKQKI